MSPVTRARWQMHFCVVLWGFTAILGKLISLGATSLVWWRMVIVSTVLMLVPRMWRGLRTLPRSLIAAYAGIGVLVALHWVTFYAAIKLANASVAASCLALCPVFLAVLEPWIARKPHVPGELWLGLAVVPGVLLVIGGIPDAMNVGVATGVLSAFIVAIFFALNKRWVDRGDPLTVTCIEMAAGAVFLTIFAPLLASGPVFGLPDVRDAMFLLLLAFACTLLPYALSLVALRHLSAFGAQLAVNLEPVYVMLLAVVLFDEQRELTLRFYLGVAIILGVVLIHPMLTRRHSANQPA